MISEHLSNTVRGILNSCLNFVPQDCVLCGGASGRALLCAPCQAELPYLAVNACPVCAGPTGSAGDGQVCGACLSRPPAYARCVAALRYAFPADALIQALKYRNQLPLARLFAAVLADVAANAPRPDVLLPMPLHPHRARARGFNQATEIARLLARDLRIPLDTNSLVRIRDTAPQATLPLHERQRNVKGAFSCSGTLAGRHVALLDDVMTSGATLNEAARTVLRAGAAEVSLWVVARALPRQ